MSMSIPLDLAEADSMSVEKTIFSLSSHISLAEVNTCKQVNQIKRFRLHYTLAEGSCKRMHSPQF